MFGSAFYFGDVHGLQKNECCLILIFNLVTCLGGYFILVTCWGATCILVMCMDYKKMNAIFEAQSLVMLMKRRLVFL
jgi:hypothetical protein